MPLDDAAARDRAAMFAGNRLLAALPQALQGRLGDQLEPVELELGQMLVEPGDAILQVCFPVHALVSLLTSTHGHPAIEVGMIGREGMVGVGIALGQTRSPVGALIQGGGLALRMGSVPFRRILVASPALSRLVLGFAGALMAQISQTAACNRFHPVDQRLARWLLMSSDRLHLPEFRMTHEFLGHMLGVRRVGITQAAHALQRSGVIEYHRGVMRILDRAALESSACECYGVVREIYAEASLLP